MISPHSWPRRCAVRISRLAAHIVGPSRPELAAAMMCEVSYIERGLTALTWSVGCLSAACAARAKSRHPILFHIGISTPLILWHLGAMLCFGMLGLLSMLGLIAKLLHPSSVGLWVDLPLSAPHRYEAASSGLLPVRVGHDHIVFGLPYDGTPATEILGPCFAPLMVGLLLFAIWSVRRSFLAAWGSARSG
jgi:hypothetical protein